MEMERAASLGAKVSSAELRASSELLQSLVENDLGNGDERRGAMFSHELAGNEKTFVNPADEWQNDEDIKSVRIKLAKMRSWLVSMHSKPEREKKDRDILGLIRSMGSIGNVRGPTGAKYEQLIHYFVAVIAACQSLSQTHTCKRYRYALEVLGAFLQASASSAQEQAFIFGALCTGIHSCAKDAKSVLEKMHVATVAYEILCMNRATFKFNVFDDNLKEYTQPYFTLSHWMVSSTNAVPFAVLRQAILLYSTTGNLSGTSCGVGGSSRANSSRKKNHR